MAKPNAPKEEYTSYRQLAEAQVVGSGSNGINGLSPEDVAKKIHELQVRLVEQELQNGELKIQCQQLRKTQAELEERLHNALLARVATVAEEGLTDKAVLPASIAASGQPSINADNGDFLSRMGHQLRTPMNAILGFSQLLQLEEDNLTPSQCEYLDHIAEAGRNLLTMINSFIDLVKVDSGQMKFSLRPVALREVLNTVLAQYSALAQKHAIQIDLPPAEDLWLYADELRLTQVLANLLANAVKYNRPHGRVTIECDKVGAYKARIKVIDNGPGMRAQDRARLFQPFQQFGTPLDNSKTAGIGLCLSRKLVVAMNGDMGCETAENQGSTFWLELPLAESYRVAAPPSPSSTAATSTAGAPRARLVYIEDNAANRRLVEQMLRKLPACQLTLVENATTGLKVVREQEPDLVLMDIELPDMNGFRALAELRADPRTARIPVIAVSAHAMQEQMASARRAGFDDYITKPIDLTTLLTVVRRNLPPA